MIDELLDRLFKDSGLLTDEELQELDTFDIQRMKKINDKNIKDQQE